MAKVAAPPSKDYSSRSVAAKRIKDIRTLRAKPVLTQGDQTTLLNLLMDDFLARNPTP